MKIGFIGLGIMGESMCENIVKKHDDTVYVLRLSSPQKVELLASKGAVALRRTRWSWPRSPTSSSRWCPNPSTP